METNYEQNAIDFLNKTGVEFKCEFLKNDFHFSSDKEKRDIYLITLTRGSRSFSFNFGQSIANSGFYYTKGRLKTELDRKYLAKDYFKGKPIGLVGTIKMKDYSFLNNGKSDIIHYPKAPTAYSVLSCLQKYDVGTFENFCSDFGYDTDSRTAETTYKAVLEEYKNVCILFSDSEIEALQEIL